MKKEVNVEKLCNKFQELANRNGLLTGSNVQQQDILLQILGVITVVAIEEEDK